MIAGDQLGVWADQIGKRVVAILEAVRIEIQPTHRDTAFLRRDQPGRDIAVVIHAGQHDLVALPPVARDHAREMEDECGAVEPEDDLVRLRAEQGGDGSVGVGHDPVGVARGAERAAVVGAMPDHHLAHARDHARRHLRAAGRIEIGTRLSVVLQRKRRKGGTHGRDVPFAVGQDKLRGYVRSLSRKAGPAYFSSHSCSGALWNFQVRFGPAMTLR